MSKLQEALKKLREDDPGRKERAIAGPAKSKMNAAAGLPDRDRNISRSEYPIGDVCEPQFAIELDLDELCKCGLFPQYEFSEDVAQQFRRIKRPVLRIAFGAELSKSDNPNVIMVASALPGSGKSFCSINLAASIARERDVGAVLVDADVLKPNISRSLGLDKRLGLIDFLLDPSITVDDILVGTDLLDIVVIPAGQQNTEATELLASRRMGSLVSELSRRFRSRAVIFDTSPLLMTNEAHVLAEYVGQIVMVVEAGVTTQESLMEALRGLNRSKPINAILNKARYTGFDYYGQGSYGYYSPSGTTGNDDHE
jgi:protein-tyrosine kinase